jgi:hypothetical protein
VSEENVELVRRAFQVGDLAKTAEAYWHPEIEYVEDPRLPGASSYNGRDAVVRCWRSYLDVLGDEDDIAITVEDVLDVGEHLWGYVVEVREERIAYLRAYYEPGEALEAAGLQD